MKLLKLAFLVKKFLNRGEDINSFSNGMFGNVKIKGNIAKKCFFFFLSALLINFAISGIKFVNL